MNIITATWDYLNGKKTYIAMGILFIYGGLSFIGYDFVWLKEIALLLGGVGLIHGAYKGVTSND